MTQNARKKTNKMPSKKTPTGNKKKSAHNDNASAKAHDIMARFPDPLALSQALMNAYQQSQPLFLNIVEQFQKDIADKPLPDTEDLTAPALNSSEITLDLMKSMAVDPMKYWTMQMDYAQKQIDLLQNSMKRFSGEDAAPIIEPDKSDRRFRADDWNDNPLFDFIKQYYLLASEHVQRTIDAADDISPEKKDELAFAAKLMIDAMSPSNFVMTNPEVLNETIRTGGKNLVQGLKNFSEDLQRGHGTLKISMTDKKAFKIGENIASTKGHVVYQNDLMQLIQYTPSTEKSYKTPLLITPPWINKYYILDLREDNSFIKWAVDQGHSVFCISWVNPDATLAQKSFEDYMHEGILEALDAIQSQTGEKQCNVIGYCLGGTLLATTLAYLAAKGEESRINSATFLTTLVDFEQAGELKLFMGKSKIEAIEKSMSKSGVFSGQEMQQTFSLLRANDLIWSFVVNNYLMGKEPFPFDLLYWNDDTTNLPAAMHSFYLRNMYIENQLTKAGGIKIDGVKIDITKIKTPCYFLSTKEDHIAPWKATYQTTQMVGGKKTFTLAASGHIAGVVNSPAKNKYCYWSADKTPKDADAWLDNAKEHEGSWWPHWQKWMKDYAGSRVATRKAKKKDILEPAPGAYVRMQGD